MRNEKLEHLMDEYQTALWAAEASERVISHLAERLEKPARRARMSAEGPVYNLEALFGDPSLSAGRPSLREVRAALAAWDDARREVRRTYNALKATGSVHVPKAPTLRAPELWILKRAAHCGSLKTMQPPAPLFSSCRPIDRQELVIGARMAQCEL